MEDRVADLRARWAPEATATAAAVAFLGIGTFGMLIASVTKKVMYR